MNFSNPSTVVGGGEMNRVTSSVVRRAKSEGASIKVLGSGCAKCNQLEAATKAALEQLGMDAAIDHVRDFAQIAAYGVMSTPALVVDGKVVSDGKVLKTGEIAEGTPRGTFGERCLPRVAGEMVIPERMSAR